MSKEINVYEGLTADEISELEGTIHDLLIVSGQKISKLSICLALFTYGHRFSLASMFRYYRYAQANNLDDDQILATIMHDLNGRGEDPSIFSPRTSSY